MTLGSLPDSFSKNRLHAPWSGVWMLIVTKQAWARPILPNANSNYFDVVRARIDEALEFFSVNARSSM